MTPNQFLLSREIFRENDEIPDIRFTEWGRVLLFNKKYNIILVEEPDDSYDLMITFENEESKLRFIMEIL